VKYLVVYKATAFWSVEVESESGDDAIDVADRLGPPPRLCHREEIELNDIWEVDTVEEMND
jgi:hypothetical protein